MFKGFLCHVTGAPCAPDECLACSLTGGRIAANGLPCPFTPPILRGIIAANQPRELLGYSATEISGCLRKARLQEQADYYLAPGQAYWAFRGQLAHALLEQAHTGDPGVILEKRFYADIDGLLFTGQVDLFYLERRLLVDYKTTREVPKPTKRYECSCGALLREGRTFRKGTSVACPVCGLEWPVEALKPTILPPQPHLSHVRQLNLYAWLLAQNGLEVAKAELVYLDMSEPLRLPVELWPLEETERYLKERLALLHSPGPDGLPAGIQEDSEENWLCRYCPVAAICLANRQAAENPEFNAKTEVLSL